VTPSPLLDHLKPLLHLHFLPTHPLLVAAQALHIIPALPLLLSNQNNHPHHLLHPNELGLSGEMKNMAMPFPPFLLLLFLHRCPLTVPRLLCMTTQSQPSLFLSIVIFGQDQMLPPIENLS